MKYRNKFMQTIVWYCFTYTNSSCKIQKRQGNRC